MFIQKVASLYTEIIELNERIGDMMPTIIQKGPKYVFELCLGS